MTRGSGTRCLSCPQQDESNTRSSLPGESSHGQYHIKLPICLENKKRRRKVVVSTNIQVMLNGFLSFTSSRCDIRCVSAFAWNGRSRGAENLVIDAGFIQSGLRQAELVRKNKKQQAERLRQMDPLNFPTCTWLPLLVNRLSLPHSSKSTASRQIEQVRLLCGTQVIEKRGSSVAVSRGRLLALYGSVPPGTPSNLLTR